MSVKKNIQEHKTLTQTEKFPSQIKPSRTLQFLAETKLDFFLAYLAPIFFPGLSHSVIQSVRKSIIHSTEKTQIRGKMQRK